MSHLHRYLRTHLAGSTAGVDLFDRAARSHPEPAASVIRRIHGELVEERVALRAMMDRVGAEENPLFNTLARIGERVGRLKPNGDLLHRTAMTDLTELEAMLIALAGKLAGWESLITVADDEPGLDRAELEGWAQQARDQRAAVRELHDAAASRALSAHRR